MKLYYRTRTVREVCIGPTGHVHREIEDLPDGPRLVIDCPACDPFLHPVEWSPHAADTLRTWDEEQAESTRAEREQRLTPEIAEIIARITAELQGTRSRTSIDEAAIIAAVQRNLAAAESAPLPASVPDFSPRSDPGAVETTPIPATSSIVRVPA